MKDKSRLVAESMPLNPMKVRGKFKGLKEVGPFLYYYGSFTGNR